MAGKSRRVRIKEAAGVVARYSAVPVLLADEEDSDTIDDYLIEIAYKALEGEGNDYTEQDLAGGVIVGLSSLLETSIEEMCMAAAPLTKRLVPKRKGG